jgi:hypothetical protein
LRWVPGHPADAPPGTHDLRSRPFSSVAYAWSATNEGNAVGRGAPLPASTLSSMRLLTSLAQPQLTDHASAVDHLSSAGRAAAIARKL